MNNGQSNAIRNHNRLLMFGYFIFLVEVYGVLNMKKQRKIKFCLWDKVNKIYIYTNKCRCICELFIIKKASTINNTVRRLN